MALETVILPADRTDNTGALVVCTGFELPAMVAFGRYWFRYRIVTTVPLAGTGMQVGLAGPAAPGMVSAFTRIIQGNNPGQWREAAIPAYNVAVVTSAAMTNGVFNGPTLVQGIIRNGPNAGDLQLLFASSVAGNNLTIEGQSAMEWRKLP